MSEESGATLSLSSKRKNSNFTQISNEFLQDAEISLACKGFICFCLSFPHSWKISIPSFRKILGIGDTAMRSLLKEAIKLGYVKRENYNENGLRRWRYEVSDWPEFKKCLPCVDNPRLGGQGLDNKRCIQDTNTTSLRSVVSKKELFLGETHGSHVKLLDSDYDSLCKEHGEEALKNMIDRMNDHLEAHGKTYKNYAAALRNWFRKEAQLPSRKGSSPPVSQEFALAILGRCNNLGRNDIHVARDYIEFISGPHSRVISYSEHGAKEQIINELRKRNISPEDL